MKEIVSRICLLDICSRCEKEKEIVLLIGHSNQRLDHCLKLCGDCAQREMAN